MKKILFACIFIFCGCSASNVLAENSFCRFFEWSEAWESNVGPSPTLVDVIVTDSNGNSYVSGQFNGTMDFGNTTLSAIGGYAAFIAKIDSSGQHVWVARAGGFGSPFIVSVSGVTTDQQGNIYLVGGFVGTVSFGNIVLSIPMAMGAGSGFLAKLNPQGEFVWVIETEVWGKKVDTDDMGNCFMVGSFEGSVTLGAFDLVSVGSNDIFISKIDSQGQYLWAAQAGGLGLDDCWDIAVDSIGNSYITGNFKESVTFGSTTLSSSDQDGYIAKLNPQGEFLWAVQTEGSNSSGVGISIDSSGNSYVIGSFQGFININGENLTSNKFSTFIAKLNSEGEFLDVIQIIDNKPGFPSTSIGITTSYSSESIFITSLYIDTTIINGIALNPTENYRVYFAELGTEKLDFKWVLAPKGNGIVRSGAISADAFGNCYSVGQSGGSTLDTLILGNDYYPDVLYKPNRFFTKIAFIDNAVIENDGTFTAVQTGVTYQWLDCNEGMIPIPGAISQSFTPDHSGSYAVALNNDFCSATSVCKEITSTNINNIIHLNQVSIFPNPANSVITISNIPMDSHVNVFDISGRLLFAFSYLQDSFKIPIDGLENGIYFIEINKEDSRIYKKIIVNK